MALTTLAEAIGRLAAYGDRIALREGERTITHAALVDEADRLANALLGLGAQAGDRFAFSFPNGIDVVLCHAACARAGLVGVPISIRSTAAEIEFQLRDSEAVAAAFSPELAQRFLDAAAALDRPPHTIGPGGGTAGSVVELAARGEPGVPPGERRPEDAYAVIYTGGTTGAPKAAIQTQGGWAATIETSVAAWDLVETDKHLLVLPMTHVAWFTCPAYLYAGAMCVLLPKWEPERVLEIVERERITHVNMIPTMLGDLCVARERRPELDLSSLKYLTVAGSPMPVEMAERAHELFGRVVGNIYGMTESAGGISFLVPRDVVGARIGSGGRPGPTLRVRIVDTKGDDVPQGERGEIVLAGPQLSPGYLRDPGEDPPAFRDGWFYSGDIGYLDDGGFLYIVDRRKDMIITGGYNVYPKEVEGVLYELPDVLEAAVVGMPDPKWIEAVHACVVLREGSTLDEDAIRQHCRERLAAYKVPKVVHFEQELPRTPVGKFDKRALRRTLEASA